MFLRLVLGLALLCWQIGCSVEIGREGNVSKSCVPTDIKPTLVFQISSADRDLPVILSGLIPDTISFDECQATAASNFEVIHTDARHATVTLFIEAGSKFHDQFFDKNNQPIPAAQFEYYLSGRRYCSDDALTLQHATTTPNWTIDQSTCGQTTFTATIE